MDEPTKNIQDLEQTLQVWLRDPLAAKLAVLLLGLVVITIITRMAQGSAIRYIQGASAARAVRRLISSTGLLVSGLFATVVFRDRLGDLTLAFGLAGAGIALALQEVIASVGGWVAIIYGRLCSVGDRIEIGGLRGDIIDIGILRMTVMEIGQWVKGDLYTGRIVVIPNSLILKEPLYNYSGDFPFLWDEITVPLKHGSDLKVARSMLEKVAREHLGEAAAAVRDSWTSLVKKYRIENATVDPMVTLVANDNWLEFTLRYVVDHRRRRLTKDLLFTAILDALSQTEGRVGLASTTFHLVETPVLDVRMISDEKSSCG